VKVFVGDNRLHILELGIRCDLRAAEHTGTIENIQPLVFHRTPVEIINGHNIEDIEVVLPPVHLFVPAHRLLEGAHGVPTFVEVLLLDMNMQCHFTATGGHEGIVDAAQVPRHQGKQVGGLGERIMPAGAMASVFQRLVCQWVAVAEQHRIARRVCLHGHLELSHDIRAIEVPGDLAKSLGLALGTEQGA